MTRYALRPADLRVIVIVTAVVAELAGDAVTDTLSTIAAAGGGNRVPGLRQIAWALLGSRLGSLAGAILPLAPVLHGLLAVAAAIGVVAIAAAPGAPGAEHGTGTYADQL